MGWWEQNEEGVSFAQAKGAKMVWGDQPADVLHMAIRDIVDAFEDMQGRPPTIEELKAGFLFSLRGWEERLKR